MSKSKKWAIGFGAAIAIAAIVVCAIPLQPVSYTVTVPYQDIETYYESEPYQVEEPYTYTTAESLTLFSGETYAVSPGYYQPIAKHIDVVDKSQNIISGRVTARAGGEFLFYVFDQKNYNAYKAGGSWQAYVDPGRVTDYSFSFIPDHSDYYYFIISNTFSFFTNKLVEISATWNWQETKQGYETVTKYRDVEKQRVVTKYRQETHYKQVSLLDYWLNYAPY